MAEDDEPLVRGWPSTTLGALVDAGDAELQTGPFGTMLHASAYSTAGVPVVAVKHIGDNRLSHDDLPRISDVDAKRLGRYCLREGDILFARKGSVDRRALVMADEADWIQGSDCIRLRLRPSAVNPQFISYVLGTSAHRSWMLQHAHGATMPSLNQDILRLIPIPIPPLSEQRRIARALGTLDEKIELNRRVNHTLESIARAIFESWFVDFDPVRRKMQGGEVGLPPDLAALFPRNIVSSEIGPIPRGWRLEPLDQVAKFLNGLALQRFPPTGESDLPAIKGAELTRGITASTGRASRELPPQFIVRQGDVLFSWSGSLHCVMWSGAEGALNQHVFKVTSSDFPAWFIFCWIQRHLPAFRDIAADKATTMGHIKRSHLADAVVVVPTDEVLAAADVVMSPIMSGRVVADVESRRLKGVRDALLSRLIGGLGLATREGV